MRVVIAGAGSVGRYMASQLHAAGHDVCVIEQEAAVAARHHADPDSPVRWYHGDACELESLAAVGCGTADVLAAATGDDEDNLVISLLAKQEFGVPRVLARVNNPDNEWMFNDMWGVDLSVSTPHLLTAMVEEAVTVGSLVRLLAFEGGRTRLAEVRLAEDSPAVGVELARLGLPRESTVVAVIRDGHVVVPHGDTVLRELDEVLVLVSGDAEEAVRHRLVG
jgi:trk system potassium uptake protein